MSELITFIEPIKMAAEIPCKRWQITLEDYTQYDIKKLQDYSRVNCEFAVLVKGVTETGTPCLQGLIVILLKRRESTLKRALYTNAVYVPIRAKSLMEHLDPMMQAKFWEHGTLQRAPGSPKKAVPRAGKPLLANKRSRRTKGGMTLYQQPLHSMSFTDEHSPAPRPNFYAIWIHGPTGVGKSHFAYETFTNAYVKLPNDDLWDGYHSEKSIIIDDIQPQDEDAGHWQLWLDKWPCRVRTKQSQCPLNADEFILTSNYEPSEVFKRRPESMLRRLTVFKVTDKSHFNAVKEFVSLQRQLREHRSNVIEVNESA